MSTAPLLWNPEVNNTRSSPEGSLNFLQGNSALFSLGISSAVLFLLLAILGFDFFDHWLQKRLVRGLPLVQDRAYLSPCFRPQPSTLDPNEALKASYYKYTKKGKAFAIKWDHPINTIVIVPPQCGKEYCMLPREHANLTLVAFQAMKITGVVDTDWSNKFAAIHASHQSLQFENIAKLMSAELDTVLPLSLNASTADWSSRSGPEAMYDIVNTLSAKLFLPFGFREHPEFKEKFDAWESALDDPLQQLFKCPEMIRPLLVKLLPACRTYKSALKDLQKMMTPALENQIKVIKQDKELPEMGGFPPFIKLLIEQELRKNPNKDVNAEHLANRLLLMWGQTVVPIAGITTSMVFEIMRHQECIEPLRKELEAALQLSGNEWNFDIFKHTPKLESYTLETLRLYPVSSISGSRYVMKPIKLPSLGITLRAGTYVSMPSRYIQSDADNYANPMKFDAYRFYDESSNTCKVLKPSETFLTYGMGTSACPARVLSFRLCQMIFSKILLGYELGPIDSKVAIQVYDLAADSFPNAEIQITTRKRETTGPNRQTPEHEIVQ